MTINKLLPLLGLLVLMAFVAVTSTIPCGCKSGETASSDTADTAPTAAAFAESTPAPAARKAEYRPAAPEIAEYRAKGLPMVLDFGKGWCKPCKAMAPDLEALHTELAGKVLVRFNDLEKEMPLAQEHKIRIMPTQVYLDGQGKEVHRNEGYASKADMLAKLRELGFLKD